MEITVPMLFTPITQIICQIMLVKFAKWPNSSESIDKKFKGANLIFPHILLMPVLFLYSKNLCSSIFMFIFFNFLYCR